MGLFPPGSMTSTHSGSPLPVIAAVESIPDGDMLGVIVAHQSDLEQPPTQPGLAFDDRSSSGKVCCQWLLDEGVFAMFETGSR